jgi:hypothetical protein
MSEVPGDSFLVVIGLSVIGSIAAVVFALITNYMEKKNDE